MTMSQRKKQERIRSNAKRQDRYSVWRKSCKVQKVE